MDAVDKSWSWVVLFGAFLAYLLVGGTLFSFGILYTDFMDRLETGALETALIAAIAFACCFFGVPFSSAMVSKLGYRFVTVAGSILAFIGMFLGCFAPSIHYYYVFFGIFVGCGFSMVHTATFIAVLDYFQQNRKIALALTYCGFTAGVFLLPLITRALLDTYSFFGTYMILSALVLNGVVCGFLLKPLDKNVILDRDNGTYKQMTSPHDHVTGADIGTVGHSSSVEDEEGGNDDEKIKINGEGSPRSPRYRAIDRVEETIVIPLSEPIRFEDSFRDDDFEESSVDEEESPRGKVLENVIADDKEPDFASEPKDTPERGGTVNQFSDNAGTPLLNVIIGVDDGKMLCDASIILYLLASVFFSMGMGTPFCFLPDVSREYGYSNLKAEWTLSLFGLGSCVGIVVSGFVRHAAARLARVSTLLVCITLLLAGFSLGFVHFFSTYGFLLLSAFLVGKFTVVFYFLRRNVICEIVPEEYYNSAYYLSQWVCGFGYMIGIPVSAWLKDQYATYTWSFVMAALSFGLSGLSIFPLLFLRNPQTTH